jgi:fatty acid desaturase
VRRSAGAGRAVLNREVDMVTGREGREKQLSQNFAREVKASVNDYFAHNRLSRHANAAMITKTVVLVALYFGSYGLILSGLLPLPWMWFFCFVMGIGMAGIGFSVTHDALHGAYSANPRVNRLIGCFFDTLGANGYVWKITHNVIHHTYTNIRGYDEDLEVSPFIRLSPHTPFKPIHRFQHVFAFSPTAWPRCSGCSSRTTSTSCNGISGPIATTSIHRSSGCFSSSAKPHTISR